MFKQISVALMLSLAAMAQANDHENPSTTDGAFITMMVQSDDPMSYISALQSNSAAFEATGTTNAGYCLTRSGHEHPGQMFVWNAYASLEDAMQAPLKYDPMLSLMLRSPAFGGSNMALPGSLSSHSSLIPVMNG